MALCVCEFCLMGKMNMLFSFVIKSNIVKIVACMWEIKVSHKFLTIMKYFLLFAYRYRKIKICFKYINMIILLKFKYRFFKY